MSDQPTIRRAGLSRVKRILNDDRRSRQFERFTLDFLRGTTDAKTYLRQLRDRFGRQFGPLIAALPSCIPEEKFYEIEDSDPATDTYLSRKFCLVLRHRAPALGYDVDPQGFVLVRELLSFGPIRSRHCSLRRLRRLVAEDEKGRYTLKDGETEADLRIRCNQGHSFEVEELDLKEIVEASECIHGTYYKAWESIRTTGLNRMGRTHIHMCQGLTARSGIRRSVEVLIYVDVARAHAEAGIRFFLSTNGVILSQGDDDGMIPRKFFLKVVDRETGQPVRDGGSGSGADVAAASAAPIGQSGRRKRGPIGSSGRGPIGSSGRGGGRGRSRGRGGGGGGSQRRRRRRNRRRKRKREASESASQAAAAAPDSDSGREASSPDQAPKRRKLQE